jgi:hypothetical protein
MHAPGKDYVKQENTQIPHNTPAEHQPSQANTFVSAVLTAAVWGLIGALGGRSIGKLGDRFPDATGPGKRAGTIIGAITASAIAFGTSIKTVSSQQRAEQRPKQDDMLRDSMPVAITSQALEKLAPLTEVSAVESLGVVAEPALEKNR